MINTIYSILFVAVFLCECVSCVCVHVHVCVLLIAVNGDRKCAYMKEV